MKRVLFAGMILALCLAAGCAPRYVDVYGERYEMISPREESQPVEHARSALKTISKRIPPMDMKFIDTNEPELRFIYAGDRYGRAIIRWHFQTYEAGVEYEGQFLSEHMTSTVFTKKKQAEVTDFTRRKKEEKPKSRPSRRFR